MTPRKFPPAIRIIMRNVHLVYFAGKEFQIVLMQRLLCDSRGFGKLLFITSQRFKVDSWLRKDVEKKSVCNLLRE